MRIHQKGWGVAAFLLAHGFMTALSAGDDATAEQAPKVLEPGMTVELGGTSYVVQRPPVPLQFGWSTRAAMGQIAWWTEGKLAILDKVHPKGVEVHPCPWRAELIAQGLDRALVWVKEEEPNRYHLAIADIQKQKLIREFPGLDKGYDWWISPSGRYLIPLGGYGDNFCFYDIQESKLVTVNAPKVEVEGAKWSWGGAVMEDNKSARLLFSSSQERNAWRTTVALDDPLAMKFEDAGPIANIEKRSDGKWLANLQWQAEKPSQQAIVSPDKWEIVRTFDRDSDEAHARLGQHTPDGKQSYYLDRSKGLTIYEVASNRVVGRGPGRDGWSFNAPTMGVTFDASGSVALFASPYDALLTALDTQTHAVAGRWKILCSGAILVPGEKGKPGQMIVMETFLPWE